VGHVNDAAVQWNWLGAALRTKTLPILEEQLVKFNSTISMTASITLILVIMVIFFAYQRLYKPWQNQNYMRLHYGDNIGAMTETCICLIKFECHRATKKFGLDARVLLVAENEELESRIWRQGQVDEQLFDLLFSNERFVFKSIGVAMRAVEERIKSHGAAKALFVPVFILISSQNPAMFGPHEHERFDFPETIGRYAIIGTGFQDIAAHRIFHSTTGVNKGTLTSGHRQMASRTD
jgi:hypothetical protein